MTRTGDVIKVKPGMVRVAFCRPDACAKCGACEGGKKETVLWLKGTASVGDTAVVDIPERILFKASVIAYLLPLVLFLGGLLLGNLFFSGVRNCTDSLRLWRSSDGCCCYFYYRKEKKE